MKKQIHMMLNSFFDTEIKTLPIELRQIITDLLGDLDNKLTEEQKGIINRKEIQTSFARVNSCSQFIRESCLRSPSLLINLIQTEDIFSNQVRHSYLEKINSTQFDDEASLMKQLRVFRRREMVRIAWRDLANWSDLNETLQDLSALAETCIQTALNYLYSKACDRYGTPISEGGTPINIVVLGMGKLGAYELNYSSDIDLIFAYPEEGELNDRKNTTYSEFFSKICRSLVKVLDQITADGFVFRTDTRLRPFGDSGPIVMSFDGMENYYVTQAREWERYAMIKARQVAGDFESGKQLMAMIKPFVYRRYLDFGAIDELRSLKLQIINELKRKDRLENIKLGPGGIREIEFIGQVFQLIRGGSETELQQREILNIIASLEKLELMNSDDTTTLKSGYHFLRRVENHIQQYQDKQTHDLPNDPLVQQILAYSMGYPNWSEFKRTLDQIRNSIHPIFNDVFSVSNEEQNQQDANLLWLAELSDEQSRTYLDHSGFLNSLETLQIIQNFKHSNSVKRLSSKGINVLNRLIPRLIEAVVLIDNQDETLARILKLFEAVVSRSVYLSLLAENPDALGQLVKLSSASPWICEYIARYPILFDELLDSRSLYEPLQKQKLAQELSQLIENEDALDIEQIMIQFREFKHLNVLRVAAADIMEIIPVSVVSDYLTYIAEVVLQQVITCAWKILTAKHGLPPNTHHSSTGFAIVGLGKLGGYELGYGSDLDMIFLYNCTDGQAMTIGNKPISCIQFYMRLGQKIRHILDTKMLSGDCYEIDLRLRPNGDSGLLVTHINSYEAYLKNEAWTWEHQALVRARIVTGDSALQSRFQDIRLRILSSSPRNTIELKNDVREMREKMLDNIAPKNNDLFDLKQSKGGIADIEFIVQFNILANAEKNKTLTNTTDNASLLDELANQGIIPKEQAELLKETYYQYRDFGHKQVLQGKRAVASADEFVQSRTQVTNIWHEYMH